MKAVCVIGGQGEGKTTFVKQVIIKNVMEVNYPKPLFVYDINGEYLVKGNELPSIDDFLKTVSNARSSLCIFEEATIFFGNRGYSAPMTDIIARKRHTGNYIVLIFHYLSAIPAYIYPLLDCIVLFRTKDRGDLVKTKFYQNPSVYEAFIRMTIEKRIYHYEIIFL